MKKILIAVMLLGTMAQADMCLHYLKSTNKYLEKAMVERNAGNEHMHDVYKKMSLQSAIDAKYECPDDLRKGINERIELLSEAE